MSVCAFASVLAFFFSFRTAVKNTRFARTCVNNNKKKKKHARRSISQGLIAHVYAQKKKKKINVLTETVPVLLNKLNSPASFCCCCCCFSFGLLLIKKVRIFWGG